MKNIYNVLSDLFDQVGLKESDYTIQIVKGFSTIRLVIQPNNIQDQVLALNILYEPSWLITDVSCVLNTLPWSRYICSTFVNGLYNAEYMYM